MISTKLNIRKENTHNICSVLYIEYNDYYTYSKSKLYWMKKWMVRQNCILKLLLTSSK